MCIEHVFFIVLCFKYERQPNRICHEVGTGRGWSLSESDKTARQAEAPLEPDPAERESALGAAILRICASLDLDAWVRALGCAPFPVPCGAFQATPMHHRGAAAGGFFLGGKEGGFTDADEAMLVLFARQAEAALANARAHRDEQRARADLEALVETCPVGVAVLDAATGAATGGR